MGFPDNVLASNERVARHLHPHWLSVAGPTVIGAILLILSLVTVWLTPNDETGNRIKWVAILVAVVVAIPLVVVPFLRWRTTHYVVTSHRVMVRRGILSKSGKDITLSKITDVSFEQSVLDRIVKAGTLLIESAGDSPNEYLRNIPHSDDVQQLVNRLIDEDANRRAGRMVERMELQRLGHAVQEAGAAPAQGSSAAQAQDQAQGEGPGLGIQQQPAGPDEATKPSA